MLKYEEMELRLSDGYRAYGRYWPVDQPRGAVLYLHGIQSHAGWYESSATALQQAGYAVLQPDRRGCGRNPSARGHAENHQQLIADVQLTATELLRRCGLSNYHLLGISWGGKLAAASYVSHPQWVKSLTLVVPGLFPQIDLPASEKFKVGLAMLGHPDKHFDIPLNDPELFTSVPHWQDFIRDDPLALRQCTAAFFLAGRRMENLVRKLPTVPPTPLHLLLAEQDRIIDTPRTAEFITGLHWPGTRLTRYDTAPHTFEFEPFANNYFQALIQFLNES
ncbi:MAG: hypothetical protein HJJLKODD_01974 [Phycisphaerae bacterium]|nr:hypothetical protein [Phycisphaerae bacterium]